MKKKRFVYLFSTILFIAMAGNLQAQNFADIESAAQGIAIEIEEKLTPGSTIAVLNLSSTLPDMSEIILFEIDWALVERHIIPYENSYEAVDLILQRMELQRSGNINESSLQAIGRELGAQFIFSGSIELRENSFRIRYRVIDVESMKALLQAVAVVQDTSRENTAVAGTTAGTGTPNINAPVTRRTSTSTGSPLGYCFLNIVGGLGSYIQGDIGGGLIITGGYAAAIGLIIWELSLKYEDAAAGVLGPIGVGFGIGSLAFGFIKPYLFNRNPRFALIMDRLDITAVSDKNNRNSFGMTYTYKY